MHKLLLSLSLLLSPLIPWHMHTPLPASGKASYYAAGVMRRVAEYRLRVGDIKPCPECIGYVAMMRKGDLGRRVWIEREGIVSGPYLVVDVAAPRDFASVIGRGIIVEVDYALAMSWGMRGPVAVRVLGGWEWMMEGKRGEWLEFGY